MIKEKVLKIRITQIKILKVIKRLLIIKINLINQIQIIKINMVQIMNYNLKILNKTILIIRNQLKQNY